MKERIINIFKFRTKTGFESYIYSVKKENNNLGYDYFLLKWNQDNEISIQRAENTIKLLQNNDIELIPVDRGNPEYTIFLTQLFTAMSQKEKGKEAVSKK